MVTKVSKARTASGGSKKKPAARKRTAAKSVKKTAVKKEAKISSKKSSKSGKKSATSKTVKKTANKKSPKRISGVKSKLEIYKLAQEPSSDKYFILANGRPVKHVAELASIITDIEDHVFHHHVNPERNDFANWVKDVFKDLELAKKMLGINSKEHLQLVIYKHAAEKAFSHKG